MHSDGWIYNMPKDLIILCDGTGDSPEDGSSATNVQILRDLLIQNAQEKKTVLEDPSQGWETHVLNNQGKTQVVYYDRGIGSPVLNAEGKLDRWSWLPTHFFTNVKLIYDKFKDANAEVSGCGVIANVAQAYKFLVSNYSPGDQIFLFGFSRGSYTLRLLITILRYIGLLNASNFTAEAQINNVIEQGFDIYNTDLHPDANPEVLEFRNLCYPHENLVHFLGLWDTVRGLVMERVHEDAKLSSVVKVARHALAIDEQRAIYKPEIWIPSSTCDSKQVWFAGAHGDVGGGYKTRGLANTALHWMVTEGNAFDLGIKTELLSLDQFKPDPLAMQNDSLTAKIQKNLDITWQSVGGIYRRPIAQMVVTEGLHESVIYRFGKKVIKGNTEIVYHPSNLTHTLVAFRNSFDGHKEGFSEEITKLLLPDPDELSDVGEDTSLLQARP